MRPEEGEGRLSSGPALSFSALFGPVTLERKPLAVLLVRFGVFEVDGVQDLLVPPQKILALLYKWLFSSLA